MNPKVRLGWWRVWLVTAFLLNGGEARLRALTLGDEVKANTLVVVAEDPGGFPAGEQVSGSQGYLALGPVGDWWYVIFAAPPNGWVTAGSLTAIPPSVPALNSPGSLVNPGPTIADLSPTLTWNPVTGANGYAVLVYDLTSSGLVYSNDSVGNVSSVSLSALPVGSSFRWVVQASDSAGFSPLSTPLYFQTEALAPAAPILDSPGGLASPGPAITNVYPAMSWTPASTATNYGLYVTDLTTGTLVYSNDTVGNVATFILPTALMGGHQFRWNMRASNSAGFSGYSSFLYFVEQSPALNAVSLSSGNLSMTISGVSPGLTVVLQSSTDLKTWVPVQTNSASGTTLTLSTSANPSLQSKFFRVIVQ